MAKFYITNGDKYLAKSKTNTLTFDSSAKEAHRFNNAAALSTLAELYKLVNLKPGWCVQKYYSYSSKKNYVITTANKFIGKSGGVVASFEKARAFGSVSEAERFIRANEDVISQLGDPVIINSNFETVSGNDLECTVQKTKRIKIGKQTRNAVFTNGNMKCQICGKPLNQNDFTVDHIVPLARGGENDLDNYRCTCDRCNKLKGSLLDDELTTAIKEVGSNCIYKNPYSDMFTAYVRAYARGVIKEGRSKRMLQGKTVT